MAVPPHHFDDEPADPQPGGLLGELERRQDDVLEQLDDLDAKLSEVLKGLEPTPVDGPDQESDGDRFAHHGATTLSSPKQQVIDEDEVGDVADQEEDDEFESAEDWA